ncbi:MAG: beta-N-acetylhexosaminidase [Pseudomonadota bacterium]
MSHGPLMLDLEGARVTREDRERLRHPACGGVILFTRNFEAPGQLAELVADIHGLRDPALLVAVDHEGGRVQRFRDGFTRLPPVARIGEEYDAHPAQAAKTARELGWLMAVELRTLGVDFSFAPVLDLGSGLCEVIGDRAFHHKPEVVARLAHAWMSGMHEAGMPAVGKHFPGHGNVVEDSHVALPVDRREPVDLEMTDMLPFQRMIHYGMEAVMPAHVIYEKADASAAGFSRYWLQDILRRQLEFQGVIFSDDLNMAAAADAGDYAQRLEAALEAGCDMALICNNPPAAEAMLESLEGYVNPAGQMRLLRMHGRGHMSRGELHEGRRWHQAVKLAARLNLVEPPELDLQPGPPAVT